VWFQVVSNKGWKFCWQVKKAQLPQPHLSLPLLRKSFGCEKNIKERILLGAKSS
jgi:hypothetical protein